MDIDLLKTDPEKEDLGTWLDYGRDSQVKVGRYNNPLAEAYRMERAREMGSKLQSNDATDQEKLDAWFEIETEALVRHVLKGWKGFKQGDKELKYSEAKAREILSDKRYREFRADIVRLATNRENYRPDAEIEEAVKPAAAS